MVGSIVGVSLISKELGAFSRGQILTAVLSVPFPMAILEATSTQNSYVVCFWSVCFIYYSMVLKRRAGFLYSIAAGCSLGLAILAKPTAYIYTFPFLMWFCFEMLKKSRRQFIKYVFIIAIAVLSINLGHYLRNMNLYGNPLGPGQESPSMDGRFKYTNDVFSVSSVASNIIRNLGLYIGTRYENVNDTIEKWIYSIHNILGIDTNDKRTTWTGKEFHITKKPKYIKLIHIVLIIVTIIIWPFSKKTWRSKAFGRYTIAGIFTFLMFCFVLKWQPYHLRLHLPMLVLLSPIVGIILSNFSYKKTTNIVVSIMILLAFQSVFFHSDWKLFGKGNIFDKSRTEQYFTYIGFYKDNYIKAVEVLKRKNKCTDIGLFRFKYEYPLWILYKKNNANKIRIEHVGVSNISGKILSEPFTPCAIISFRPVKKLSLSCRDKPYRVVWSGGPISVLE